MSILSALRSSITSLVLLTAIAGPVHATVTTLGDVVPGGVTDPWAIGGDLNLKVGDSGNGTLNVESGGVVNSDTHSYIGFQSGSTGEATISGAGSQWNNLRILSVGDSGDGTLIIEDGGVLSTWGLNIGKNSSSTSEVTVTGANSQLQSFQCCLQVGSSGDGRLNVMDGGVVSSTSGSGSIGRRGVATVTGANSQWGILALSIGFDSGTATLNLLDSGLVTVRHTIKLYSTGTINLDGGSLTTGSFDNSELGTLNFHDGMLTVNGAGGVFNPGTTDFTIDGSTATDLPELVIANTASTTLSGALKVGLNKQGNLTVESGGIVSSGGGVIGYNSSITNEATVTGAGSKWINTGMLTIALASGSGTLTVADGGLMTNTVGVIGASPNTNGQVTVSGANSKWINTDYLNVGDWGNGTLAISGGGQVQNTIGYLGQESGATGLATVTGSGSRWTNADDLIVGDSGNATLNIENGAMVTSRGGSIGRYGSAIAQTTVSNIGSTWAMGANLSVGTSGDGALTIIGSGTVSNVNGYVAWESGSTGEVTVSGTGSTWTNSGDLHIGKSGSGSVNITDSAEVQVGGMTQLYANGTVNIDGGTMSVGKMIDLEAGSTVHLNSGSLSVRSFSGDGRLAWNGGTLEITMPTGLTVGGSDPFSGFWEIPIDGMLKVTNTTTIESGAEITALGGFSSDLLKIESGGQFDVPSGYTNNDEIQLSGADARITGGVLTNDGFISGQGRINTSLINTGQVEASNGTLRFGSQVTNNGQINASNSTLRFGSQVTNNASGFISGQGTSSIHFNGDLNNTGNILLSFASSTVFGNITNNSGGMVSLAGNSTATFVGDLVNNGTVYVGSGSHTVFGGDTSGSGNYPGSGLIEFVGGFSPGSSPAEVSFGGDVILGTSSTTWIELGETSDQLLVDGNASIDGVLNVELLGDFTPTHGDEFPVITAGTRDGEFDTIDGIQVAADLTLAPIYDYADHIGLMLIAAAPGDANFDGIVDVADLGILGANFNAADMQWNTGDFNLDGTTDVADLGILGANWTASQSTGNASALVPEPATLSLLAMSVLVVGRRRR